MAQTPTTLYVSVIGTKSGPLPELKKENFKVTENKVEQSIENITIDKEAMSIGFVFDASASFTPSEEKDYAVHGIFEIAKKLGPESQYFILGLDRRIALLADWTNDPKEVTAGLSRLPELRDKRTDFSAPLYDALSEAIEKLKTGKHPKRVLVVFTDGMESGSKIGRNELLRLASLENVLVYSILLWVPERVFNDPMIRASAYGRVLLMDLQNLTGGHQFSYTGLRRRIVVSGNTSNGNEIRDDTFARLYELLTSQYSIRYTPLGTTPTKKRKLKVEVVVDSGAEKGKGDIYVLHRQYPVN